VASFFSISRPGHGCYSMVMRIDSYPFAPTEWFPDPPSVFLAAGCFSQVTHFPPPTKKKNVLLRAKGFCAGLAAHAPRKGGAFQIFVFFFFKASDERSFSPLIMSFRFRSSLRLSISAPPSP